MTQFTAPHSTETLVKLLHFMAEDSIRKSETKILRGAAERLSNLDQQVGILQADKKHVLDELIRVKQLLDDCRGLKNS